MRRLSFVCLWALAVAGAFALEPWAKTCGSDLPFAPGERYAGFGMAALSSSPADALELAKRQAAAALANQIRVRVRSDTVAHTTDSSGTVSSTLDQSILLSSDIELPGIQYLTDRDKSSVYALAWIRKADLLSFWEEEMRGDLGAASSLKAEAERLHRAGDRVAAYERYTLLLPVVSRFCGTAALYRSSATPIPPSVFASSPFADLAAVQEYARTVSSEISRLAGAESRTLDDVFYFLADQLVSQGLSAGAAQVPALTFRASDFSSAFGRYAGDRLQSAIASRLAKRGSGGAGSGTTGATAVTGRYTDQGEPGKIEISLTARNAGGRLLGSAFARFSASLVPAGLETRPQNFREALSDQYAIESGAFVDGSIHVEAWTNRGSGQDSVVFSAGEEVRLFFRVNQPAYLQIVYVLVTGQKVLLEPSFYIGMDKVNKVVEYPVAFTPTPPFGVERLLVTATSTLPALPAVYPETVDGTEYEVFRDYGTVFAATRGLKATGVKPAAGETALSITTMPAAAGGKGN